VLDQDRNIQIQSQKNVKKINQLTQTVGKDKGGAHMRGKEDKSNPATCQACHGLSPHKDSGMAAKLNHHTDKIACQTCHIPAIARGGVATKMSWDWSTAGRQADDQEGRQGARHLRLEEG